MIRRRRSGRTSPVAADGDLVIDGRIRARLLGLPLLDLDAHVVVGPARVRGAASRESPEEVTPRTAQRATVVTSTRRSPLVSGASTNGASSQLGRAVRLLGEGSSALDDARSIRRRALTAPRLPGDSDASA